MVKLDELKISDTVKIVIQKRKFDEREFIDIRKWINTEKYTGYTKKGIAIDIEQFPKLLEKLNKLEL